MKQSAVPIDVLIRVNETTPFFFRTLQALRAQTAVALRFLLVDTSRSGLAVMDAGHQIKRIQYVGDVFNYSKAINIAIPDLLAPFTLIISSHTVINNPSSLQFGIGLLEIHKSIAAVCFSGAVTSQLEMTVVNREVFNGFNGAWNTATLYRTELLKERTFREEVFSAEDQEWSRWAIMEKGLTIAHLKGCGMMNLNPYRKSSRKLVNEWICVAYYADRRYLRYPFIASRLLLALRRLMYANFSDARHWFSVGFQLFCLRFRPPKGTSAYR